MRNYFKYLIYSIVIIGYSICNAGSFDDFFAAVKRNDGRAIEQLIKLGFDANTPDPSGQYALFLAIREPAPNVINALLNWPKINVESRNKTDESPLMMAAFMGDAQLCKVLIARDADVNKPGWAPLHYAATKGHLEVIKLLLNEHAYIDAASPNGSTPLMMAALYGTPEAVSLLLDEGADPLLKNIQGLTAIDFAHRGERKDAAAIVAEFVRGRQPKGKW